MSLKTFPILALYSVLLSHIVGVAANVIPQCKQYIVEPPPIPVKYRDLVNHVHVHSMFGPHSYPTNETFVAALRKLSMSERDTLAYYGENGTPIYFEEEAAAFRAEEEKAVLLARPKCIDSNLLNGINIGAGGRSIPGTLAIDAHRTIGDFTQQLPKGQENVEGTFLGWADKLPFANNSLDFIVSLHNLEHLANPIITINHYLDILKPGGGIGIVIPDMRYVWRHYKDDNEWGHRWTTTPEFLCYLHHNHWSQRAHLELISKFSGKLSFGFVLRKLGTFVPFNSNSTPQYGTGKRLFCDNNYIGPAPHKDRAKLCASCKRDNSLYTCH